VAKFLILALFIAIPLLPAIAQSAGGDERQIAELIQRINHSWTTIDGVGEMRSVMSDSGSYAVLRDPRGQTGNVFLGKDDFLALFDRMLKGGLPKKHVHTTKALSIVGSVAYEVGELEHVDGQGNRSVDRQFFVYVKQAAGWRLQTTLPLDAVEDIIARSR
jgi:hypothetical protein